MAKREKGFSLLELLTTLTILILLVTLGIPSYRDTVQRSALDTSTQKIARVLYSSRQLAVTHNSDITTCMAIGNRCQPTWAKGDLTIFFDENDNKQIDTSEQVFSRIQISNSGVSLNWSGSGGRPYIRFNHVGFAREFGNVLITAGTHQKKIILNRAGRLYLKTI